MMENVSLPNLFLIGAPKAGTSALAHNLASSPDVYCWKKEPRYFDAGIFFDHSSDYPINSLEDYLIEFDNETSAKAKYRLDASVFVMYSKKNIERILRVNPNAKFILLLRDPLTATKSMFKQRLKYVSKNMREVSDDFGECWDKLSDRALGKGFPEGCRNSIVFRYDVLYHYERYVPDVVELVGAENILILRYEDYRSFPSEFINVVFSWLNIEYKDDMDPSASINPSVTLSSGAWNFFLQFAANKTLGMRKKFGLTGSAVTLIKKIALLISKEKNITIDHSKDKLIIDEFKATYKYIDSAEREGLIVRVDKKNAEGGVN